jgi:hypothetical protein
MSEISCPKCHKPIGAAEEAAFCPFCGERLVKEEGPDLSAALAQDDPVKKHDMLLALREQYPESLAVAEQILYMGRLYERSKKGLDFSVIKCYVLNVYLEPKSMKPDQREELRREIFHHPDLDACLKLTEDPEVFLRCYLERLSEDFTHLFLKGSSLYMHAFFGYVNERKAPKNLAAPAAGMLMAMRQDETLTGKQRTLLMQSFYRGFAHQMDGQTQYLDELLNQYNLTIDQS